MRNILIVVLILSSSYALGQKPLSRGEHFLMSGEWFLNHDTIPTWQPSAGVIVADHSVVALYDDIPQQWIDSVKKMWVSIAGESHSGSYRVGAQLLENQSATYAVSIIDEGTPQAYTTSNLRLSRATWGDHDQATGWIYLLTCFNVEKIYTFHTILQIIPLTTQMSH